LETNETCSNWVFTDKRNSKKLTVHVCIYI
jgi:hypothetical protein